MRITKAKQAAKSREKQKNSAEQVEAAIMDPEYAPPSDDEEPLERRKHRHENSDLYEKTTKRSRTSEWRYKNRITKKARDETGQGSIANIFFKLWGAQQATDNQVVMTMPPGLSSTLSIQESQPPQFEPDSDVEMISRPVSPAMTAPVPVESLPAPILESPPSPAGSLPSLPPVESSASAEPDIRSDNGGYSTNDTDDGERLHQLSLEAADKAFKKFESKLKKYRKLHLSPRVVTAMTPEKGAQRMMMVNGLMEFNIQRHKREIEHVKLAKKTDQVPRPQRPKLRAWLRKIKPSIAASIAVANQFSKTKYWAQKLRSAARTFAETGELVENNQGKGAKHKTHFDDPDVKPRLEAFARGLVPEAEGGFKGRMLNRRFSNAYQYEDKKEDEPGASTKSGNSTSNLKEIPPNLKPGDTIYYPIFHDESTVHANDQSHFVWETDDQHDPAELEAERLRLEAEAVAAAAATEKERIVLEKGKKPRKKCAPKEKQAQKAPPATDRTVEGLEWTPPPPPAPFKRYRCEQYDACRIIHPGAGHDPYWDMPQLIAQVSVLPED
ncbi:hypothetical protein B0H17DRAFT_1129929 [Mycena rosella]|uniref:Uncharacterized protein n=1 Tax=Mycena rosella TaxID=1033263 RepID=A0AAD7DT50_MYCRO|nr:hypothetical protein B0H17DRAFT_1129929 [Mycena rosella]